MSVLDFLRQEEPRFESVPDEQLIDFIVRDQPEFLKDPGFRKQARSLFGQQANADQSNSEFRADLADSYNPLLSTAIGRSFTRGSADLGQSLISAGDAAQSLMSRVGLPENIITQTLREGARSFLRGGQAIPAESESDIRSAISQGPAATGAFLLERGIGEQLPQMIGTALTGGAAAWAGMTPKAASIFAILANTFPQETGGAFEEIKQATGKEAPFTAAGVGAINAFLETLGDSKLVERMLGGDQLVGRSVGEIMKRLALRTAGQSAKEAGTEAAQELVTALAPVVNGALMPSAQELGGRIGGAAALGAVGGGVFSAGTDVGNFASYTLPALIPEQQGELTRAQRRFLQPGVNGLEYSEGLPVRPGQIGFNEPPVLALPGEAPPLPVTQLPVRSEIPSSITPSELVDLGFGIQRPERDRPAFDTPLVDPGIQLEPTMASQAAAARVQLQQEAEANRISAMTREQQAAQEMLTRIASERQQAISEAQQLEQAGNTHLANLRFATDLAQRTDQLLALGQRLTQPVPELAPVPNTDLGLQEAPPQTIAPPPVDAAILGGTTQPAPVVELNPVATNPVVPTVSGFTTDQGSTYTVDESGRTTRTKSQHKLHDPKDVGLKPASEITYYVSPDAATAIGMHGSLSGKKSIAIINGKAYALSWNESQNKWGVAPSDRQGYEVSEMPSVGLSPLELWNKNEDGTWSKWHPGNKITDIRFSEPIQEKQELAPTQPAPPKETLRQQGQTLTLTITPSRQQAMEDMRALPQEEQDQASFQNTSGKPVGNPQTNAGRLLQEWLYALPYIREQAAVQGIQLDAEAEANMERRYQELAMDAYIKAESKRLGLHQVISRKQLFRGALRDTNRMNNTAGNLRDLVGSTEMETESGAITRPEVERVVQEQSSPEDIRGATLNFLDQFDSQAQKWAAANLMARAMGYPVTPSKSARQTKFENDPELQARVAEFVRIHQPTRNSLAELVRSPMSVASVSEALNSILPNSSQVMVVDDPNLKDSNGNPIRAQYRPGTTQPFVLNAAYLGDAEDVRRALYEELMHGVWSDSEVASAWSNVRSSLTPEDLQAVGEYPEDLRQEEAAIRKVINEIESDAKSPSVVRWIKAAVDAIKRLFGVETTTDAQKILSRALAARSGGNDIRNSLAEGLWANTGEAQEEAAVSGDPTAVLGSAAAQGSVIPHKYIDQLSAVPVTSEQRTTKRLLKPVADVATMGRDLVSNFAPASPDAMITLSGMQLAPDNAQDIAAEAMVKQHLRLQSLRREIQARQVKTAEELEQALGRIPDSMIAENSAELYRGMADQLADDYRDYLKDQMLTLKRGAFNPETEREINDASRRVTEDYRGIGNAVANGLRAIAREIPEPVLASLDATRSWIESRLNDPTAERLMSDTARDWLLSPVGSRVSPIQRDTRLNQRLAAVKKLAEGNAEALADLKAFQSAFNDKKVSPEAFAKRWNLLRAKYVESMATMREINRRAADLEAEYNGQEEAIKILEQILADPEHQAPVDQAINHLQATTTIRQYERTGDYQNGRYTGKINYQNPATGEVVKLDLRPDFGKEAENAQKIRNLLADVQTWGATTDDLVLKNSWVKEADWLQRFGMGQSTGIVTGTHLGGYRLPSVMQWSPFGREVTMGRVDVRGPAYQRIGNRVIQGALQAAVAAGQVDREIRILEQKHRAGIHIAINKAVQSHGRKIDNEGNREAVLRWYVPNILEPLVSQNQNPTSRPYQIGDFIDGEKITKEDFDAIKAMKALDVDVFAMLQKVGRDSATPTLYYNPLQTAEEVEGKPLSRRSTDYGWKMPRRPESRDNERGKVFTQKWIEATDGLERRELLDEAYSWVLMRNGLITNTDREFSPKLEPRDQKLFREIQDLQRTNSLPFDDLDSLVSWAGEQQATDTMPEAQAAAEFELRLMGYVDTFTRAFNRAMEIVPKETADQFAKLNVPPGTVDSVGVSDSPFLKPRGRLIAPPSFYRYTTVDDQSWGSLMAGVRTAMTLREVEAISAAQAAIKRELERFESKTDGEIVQMQRRLKSTKGSRILWNSPRRRIARNSKARAEAGQLMYDYLTLKQHEGTIDTLLKDLKRIGSESMTTPEDSNRVAAARQVRTTMSTFMLQAITSVFRNVFGASVANSLYKRSLGRWNFLAVPAEMLHQEAKYLVGGVIAKARKIHGIDSTLKSMLDTPGFQKLAEILVGQQMQWERDRANAMASRTVDEPDSKEKAQLAKLYPETGGRLVEEDPGPLVGLVNSLVSNTPGVARALEASKNTFPGGFDRMINQITTSLVPQWTNEISEATNRAWAARDTGEPGWDDLTQPFNRFTAQDLGLPSETNVNSWRTMLAPAGSLESLSLDQYKRQKAAANGVKEPLLTEGQTQTVAQEIARSTNMGDASNTPTLFQGRGVSGEVRKSLFMLLRYAINFAAVNENLAGKAYGDNTTAARQWRLMSGAAAIVMLLLVASLGDEAGQEVRQVVTGDPRTRASIASILSDPNLKDVAKYGAISLSSLMPFMGQVMATALGGTANRPVLDASQMFAPLSLAMDLQKAATQIFQSGDMTYPIADLARRYIPLSGTVINRVMPGEIESREASRAVRLSAPSDMELRQGGGTGGRQTPQTPLIREAVDAALSGDASKSKAALDKAVQLRVAAGQTEKDARQSVTQAFQSRDPERQVLGRTATPEERQRLLSRMSSSQRRAYLNSRSVFKRKDRTKVRRLSSTRRRSSRRRRST
jgi:hypothetical protein